ncbi:MAG: hypothetical protein AMXMBFR16_00190 [Candidatus Uhrbacteria bacterium]
MLDALYSVLTNVDPISEQAAGHTVAEQEAASGWGTRSRFCVSSLEMQEHWQAGKAASAF